MIELKKISLSYSQSDRIDSLKGSGKDGKFQDSKEAPEKQQ